MLEKWLLAVMLTVQPLGSRIHKGETPLGTLQRYEAISKVIAEESKKGPFLIRTKTPAKDTALMMLAITWHESGWSLAVDSGKVRGDQGRSFCIAQRMTGRWGKSPEGWTGKDLIADRRKCIRSALNLAGKCVGTCGGGRAWLAAYGSGSCKRGRKAAGKRWETFDAWRWRFRK